MGTAKTPIVRSWSGRTTVANAAAYVDHLQQATIPHLREIPGFLGIEILQSQREAFVDFLVQSRWESMAAIHGFAGDDIEIAVVPQEAQALLDTFERNVRHYETAVSV